MADRSLRSHPPVTFAVLALGVGAFALLQSLVVPVLTTVQHELHTSQNTVTWVLTAYLLSASIMTPILGRVGDMTGKKRVFVATLAALAIGSLLAAVAPSIGVLIAARVIQGSEAPTWGWGSGRVLGLLAAAVVLAAAWLMAELRAATPLIDMKMMRRTAVWTNNLVALLIGVGMYATFAFLPEFVQTPPAAGYGFGASITRSGLMLLPSAITMFIVGIFAGRLARRLGGKTLVIGGCLIGGAAMTILAFAHQYEWQIYLSNALMGIGFGLVFSAMSALIVAAVPPSQTGVASGMNANIRTIGGSIGSAVMASIVTSQLAPNGLPKEAGYTTGFAVMTCGLLLAALAGLLMPSAKRLRQAAGEPEHAELAMIAAGTVLGDQTE